MKYRIDLYRSGSVTNGTQVFEDINTAIAKAKEVSKAYKGGYTKIARVGA